MNDIAKVDDRFSVLSPGSVEKAIQAMKDNQVAADPNLLDKIKIPTGDGRAFILPGIEGDEDFKSFQAIILGFNDHRVYYKDPFSKTGGGEQPDCISEDMEKGKGDPGGPCNECINNEWESAENGKGKACTEKRLFMLLMPNDIIPVKLDAPATSLQNLRKYFMRLASKSISFNQVVTEFSLERDKNENGVEFSKVTAKVATHLSETQKEGVLHFSNALNQ